ncbi:plasmid replication protein RepC, partial [Marivivens sp.]|uniref:plasmid replication protein RepC n=1 Tax=Marivivens sp. TaxID=1978374 RepID=UPI0025C2192D
MDIYATTPFGRRPVTAGLIERAALRQQAPALPTANKWELFRELCTARKAFGLSDRDLTVLNALLTFHRGEDLSASEQLIVFPSNETLSSRAHGMPESTLRRHIAALVEAGIILRNDSPNGKRYAVKSRTGVLRAYGFDLRPLLVRADEIIETATKIREEDAQKKELRDTVVILKRDADKLISFGMEDHADQRWTKPREALIELGKMLRRKLDISTLTSLKTRLHALVENLHQLLGMAVGKTTEMSGTDSQNERHQSNSNNTSIESAIDVSPESILDYVAGLVIVNDYSARDIQIPQMQFYKGKSFRTFGPVGPWLCLLEPGDDAYLLNLDLELKVDGEIR